METGLRGKSVIVTGGGSNIGKGTVLAEIELPKKWAQKAQAFIYMELRHAGPE